MSVSEISPPRRHTSKAYLYRASNSTGLANARLKLGSFGLARHKYELATYVQMNPNFLESDLWTKTSVLQIQSSQTAYFAWVHPEGSFRHTTLQGEP